MASVSKLDESVGNLSDHSVPDECDREGLMESLVDDPDGGLEDGDGGS